MNGRQIKRYRQAVKLAADGKLGESFERLDKMGAVVSCGLADQADKLADEYLRLAEQDASAVVVSQTWAEVHRVNSRVRDALKSKGLLGAQDTIVQALDKLDLTNAQKRDERFYPQGAVVVFNQKVRQAEPGAKGKLAGHLEFQCAGRGQRAVRHRLEQVAGPFFGLPATRIAGGARRPVAPQIKSPAGFRRVVSRMVNW